jgi:hypothetical protein
MGSFFLQSRFEPEVYVPTKKFLDRSVEPMEGASPSSSRPAVSRKNKRKSSSNIPEEKFEVTLINLQTGEGSSRVLGRGKHPFPSAQKFYIRRRKRLLQETKEEPRMPSKIHESEPVEVHSNPVQHKEPIPDVIHPNSSSSEDDAYRYRVLVRKMSTRPQNRFRLKSKAMYDPAIKYKVIVIDEEPTSPKVESLESKKVSTTRSE